MSGPSCTVQRQVAESAARAWLANSVESSAVAAAEEAFTVLIVPAAERSSSDDLAQQVEDRGLGPLLAWADVIALAGIDREPWAREAAMRAVWAYAGRLGELMTAIQVGAAPNEARQ